MLAIVLELIVVKKQNILGSYEAANGSFSLDILGVLVRVFCFVSSPICNTGSIVSPSLYKMEKLVTKQLN